MAKEIWKGIPGWIGKYEVSNLGNVRSLDRFVDYSDGRKRFYPSKTLKPYPSKGYLAVELSDEKRGKFFRVHRLVATVFIKAIENKPFVNHINGVKTDNRLVNLEWCTQKENVIHSIDIGTKKSKLNSKTAEKIRQEYSLGKTTHRILAEKYNIAQYRISNVINHKVY